MLKPWVEGQITPLVFPSQRYLVYHNANVPVSVIPRSRLKLAIGMTQLESTLPNALFSFLLTHILKYEKRMVENLLGLLDLNKDRID